MAAYARRMFAGGAINTTVPLAIGSGDGSFTLATGGSTNWPDGSTGNFVVIVDASNPEKILCSARSGLVVTVAASGRGYDGTSAVSHTAGSAIQCIHCAQDDDEANQVVSAVLGQSGAAKGDILYMLSAAGPNTLKNLAVGSNGSVLSAASAVPAWSAAGTSGMVLQSAGSSVPTWGVLPGTLLATQQFAPGSLSTYTLASGALTAANGAVDTTNLTISFNVPASGNVNVEVEIDAAVAESTSLAAIFAGLFVHGGSTQHGKNIPICWSNSGTIINRSRFTFVLTGETPGALQLDLAAIIAGGAGSSGSLYALNAVGGSPSVSQRGPAIIRAFAA